VRHHPGVSERQRLIRDAFAAYAEGDFEPLEALFDPDARWLGVPQGREAAETPACHDRREIVGLLARHFENERRFELGDMIEQGERVAVEITVVNPDWSGPVSVFKVFTFRPGENVVVRLNDCIDESYALQVLAA
jgi:ketosteroid isomerase-like protein